MDDDDDDEDTEEDWFCCIFGYLSCIDTEGISSIFAINLHVSLNTFILLCFFK